MNNEEHTIVSYENWCLFNMFEIWGEIIGRENLISAIDAIISASAKHR